MKLPRQLERALRWPAFMYALGVLYWSGAIGGLTHYIRWLQLWGTAKRNDVLGWAQCMQMMFRFKVVKVGDGQLYRGKCIYLVNHRSWADMLIDQYVTEGRAMFMSRWAMFFVFPPLLAAMLAMRVILLFKRGSIADKDGFNKWIDRKREESPQPALVVYPEGHRNTRGTPLPLKRGMLYYAYSRQLPVQIITGRNKEAILSEKGMVARLGQRVGVAYSVVIESAKYDSIESFFEEVQRVWDAQWQQVYSAKLEGLPELVPGPPDLDYSPAIRAAVGIAIPVNIALFLGWIYLCLRAAAALLALCGPLRLPVQLLLALWVAGSAVQASQRVDAVALEEQRRQRKEGAAAIAAAEGKRK